MIEASAGTGKTFTIVLLYLRLLLGLGGKNAYFRTLSVKEILVLTFTKAGVVELRRRIRESIFQLRLGCTGSICNDKISIKLLPEILDKKVAAKKLFFAERHIDEATIFTIHGFFRRILNSSAFEASVLFDQKFIEDESALLRQASEDFWRRQCYSLPLDIARVVSAEWKTPNDLLKSLLPWLQRELPDLLYPPLKNETLFSRHASNVFRINSIKKEWCIFSTEIESIILSSDIEKRIYNKNFLSLWINKINYWANSKTFTYQVPKELKRFGQETLIEKTKNGKIPRHSIFISIDDFLSKPLLLHDLIIARALKEIPKLLMREKDFQGLLSFDDLLSSLDAALQSQSGIYLAKMLRKQFPVALIDEFQDTNFRQYRIFYKLYFNQMRNCLVLIGDPKQAIYGFRGADIFTYFKARKEISIRYTLKKNWRSSLEMVRSVNRVFSQLVFPFLFPDLPFISMKSPKENEKFRFLLYNQVQPALRFWVQSYTLVKVCDYKEFMAKQCAADISCLLFAGQKGNALLEKSNNLKSILNPSDITVLVRTRSEANLIHNALSDLGISSIYLSGYQSVYSTSEARELLWLLEAILDPQNEYIFRRALSTSIFSSNLMVFSDFIQDKSANSQFIKRFFHWKILWRKNGILAVVHNLIIECGLLEKISNERNFEEKVKNLIHLAELLEKVDHCAHNPYVVLRFLTQKIITPNDQLSEEQIRVNIDPYLVQIISIHKAKGLEYPVVWIPFICDYREIKVAFYHDRESSSALLDLQNHEKNLKLAKKERLAEDLRLLYVGLTRAIYHCSVGVAPLIKRSIREKNGNSELHKSALGFLIQKGKVCNALELKYLLSKLEGEGIEVLLRDIVKGKKIQYKRFVIKKSIFSKVKKITNDDWCITSYSKLREHEIFKMSENCFDLNSFILRNSNEESSLNFSNLPRGSAFGVFLHTLFESLKERNILDPVWLTGQLEKNGYILSWLPVLQVLIKNVLNVSLNEQGLKLSLLKNKDCLFEMPFYLSVDNFFVSSEFEKLSKMYDPISRKALPLNFCKVRGMLKGIIDLIFRWKNKFYLLDYKSNWLGNSYESYSQEAIEKAMIDNRYDFQYQLYALALHRYLRHRLKDYSYEKDFGGIFYLFFRGIEKSSGDHGIFSAFLHPNFIRELDKMFSNGGKFHT